MRKLGKYKKDIGTDRFGSSGVNPMDGVGNLSDVMLVLAVGIMVALIAAFNVDLTGDNSGEAAAEPEASAVEESELENINASEAEDAQSLEDLELSEYGIVYKDADGNYYIIEN